MPQIKLPKPIFNDLPPPIWDEKPESKGESFPSFLGRKFIKEPTEILGEGIKNIQALGRTSPHRIVPDALRALEGAITVAASPFITAINPFIEAGGAATRAIPYVGKYIDPEAHLANISQAFGINAKALASLLTKDRETIEAAEGIGQTVGSVLPFAGLGTLRKPKPRIDFRYEQTKPPPFTEVGLPELPKGGIPAVEELLLPSTRKQIVEKLGKDTETRFGVVKNLSDKDLITLAEEGKVFPDVPLNEVSRVKLQEMVDKKEITQVQADEAFAVKTGDVNIEAVKKLKEQTRSPEVKAKIEAIKKEAIAKTVGKKFYSPKLRRIVAESEVERVEAPLGIEKRVGGKAIGGLYKRADFEGTKSIAMPQSLYEEGRRAFGIETSPAKMAGKKPEVGGQHRPMAVEGGAARLHDLTPAFGEDIYSKNALQYFGTGDKYIDIPTLNILKNLRGKPEADVMVYRAVPKNISVEALREGDWVTVNKQYAIEHGKNILGGDYKIIQQKVKAKDLTTNVDSFNEQGYYPPTKPPAKMAGKGNPLNELVDIYNSTGRVAIYHPRRKTLSINGREVSLKEGTTYLQNFANNMKTQTPKPPIKPEEPKLFGGFPRLGLGFKLSEKVGKLLPNSFREFWSQTSTIPQSQEYLFKRSETKGFMDKVDRIVDDIFKRTDKYPQDAKANMFNAVRGKYEIEKLPIDQQKIALELKRWNDNSGKMLVKRGVISEESYNKIRDEGGYIHYMYLKHVLGNDVPIPTTGGGIDVSILKHRKDLTSARQKAIGLIEDISIAGPVGLAKSLKDVGMHDFFEFISKNPNWVYEPSVVKVGKRKYGILELKNEVETYEKMMQKSSAPEIKSQYNELKTAYDNATKEMGEIPKGFTQLPDSPTYGSLRGTVVRTPIARDIQPLYDTKVRDIGKITKLLYDIETKSMAAFKLMKVPMNLPTVVRNIGSNHIQLNMKGIPLGEIPFRVIHALTAMSKNEPSYIKARRAGLFKTNWSVEEIANVMDEFRKIKGNKVDEVIGIVKNLAKYYGKIDDVFKYTSYLDDIGRGVSHKEAILNAQKWGMDYSLASPSVKIARKHFVPFGTYTYKIIPLLAETIIDRPHIILKYAILPYLMSQYVKEQENISDEGWTKLLKQLPYYIKENRSYMVLPHKDEKGNLKWVNMEYFYPWGNLLAFGRDVERGNVGGGLRSLGVGSNPALLVANTFLREKPTDPYTNKPIYDDIDTPKQRVLKSLEYIYQLFLPTMLTQKGALGKTLNIGKGNQYGQVQTLQDAALRWVGVNIIAPTKEQTVRATKARQKELLLQYYNKMRDKDATPEKRKEYMEQTRKELMKLYK